MKLYQKSIEVVYREIVYRGLVIRAVRQENLFWIAYIRLESSARPDYLGQLSGHPFPTAQSCLRNAKDWVNERERHPHAEHIRTSLCSVGLSIGKAAIIALSMHGFPTKAEKERMPEIWREAVSKNGEVYHGYGIVVWRTVKGWHWARSRFQEIHWQEGEQAYPTRSKALLEARRSILMSSTRAVMSQVVWQWYQDGKISRDEHQEWVESRSTQWYQGRNE